MDTILKYENGDILYSDFQDFMWSSGRFLFQDIGEDMYVFYLMAAEGEFYPDNRKSFPTNYTWCD